MSTQHLLKPLITACAAILAILCAASANAVAQEAAPDDPHATVFLKKLGKGEGAPAKANLDTVVVLSEVGAQSPYYRVTQRLVEQGAKQVIRFRADALDKAFARLKRIKPGYVAVVVRPGSLDVRFHFEFLERASRLDGDPFVDFAFGYLTGRTADEALAFVDGIAKARKMQLPKRIVDFGPSSRPRKLSPDRPHNWARKFKTATFHHEHDSRAVAAELAALKKVGVLKASGHGMPDGVHQGLKGSEIRAAKLDLHPALYFSGPCYCGVTNAWMNLEKGKIVEQRVPLDQSFVLALIGARVTAAFAGLNPDRGETNSHEFEHVLITGEPLGMASKSTYDDAVLAYRRPEFALPEYEIGGRRPFRNISDQMISGGACRALFGDPTFRPFKKAGDDPFAVKTRFTAKGLVVTWEAGKDLGKYWRPVDVYRAKGGWTHRLRFRFTVPRKKVAGLKRFRVVSVTKDGEDLPFQFATAGLEAWGGEVRVHAMVIFPPDAKNRALWNGKEFTARLLFEK